MSQTPTYTFDTIHPGMIFTVDDFVDPTDVNECGCCSSLMIRPGSYLTITSIRHATPPSVPYLNYTVHASDGSSLADCYECYKPKHFKNKAASLEEPYSIKMNDTYFYGGVKLAQNYYDISSTTCDWSNNSIQKGRSMNLRTLTKRQEATLEPETRALLEAYVLTDTLELTPDGRQMLAEWLFETNQAKFAKHVLALVETEKAERAKRA